MPVTNRTIAGAHGTSRQMQIVRLADQLIARHETAMCRDGIPDLDHVRRLATWLAWAVDQTLQQLVGEVDHRDWSHQTALSAVRAALHSHPIPWDAPREQRTAWLDQLVDRAVGLATIAIDLERDARVGRQHHDRLRRVS